jgi:hypothetical protein
MLVRTVHELLPVEENVADYGKLVRKYQCMECPIIGVVWSIYSLILSLEDFNGLNRMRHRWAVGAGYPVCKKLARSRKGPVDQTLTAATTVRLGVISPPTTSNSNFPSLMLDHCFGN